MASRVGVGVDRDSGALLVRTGAGQPLRAIDVGDVVRCEVEDPPGNV